MSPLNKQHTHRLTFAAGQQLFREGEVGDVAYIIESGKVHVTRESRGQSLHIATVCAGELVGEMALIDDAPRSATVTAVEDSEVFVIDRDLLRERLRHAAAPDAGDARPAAGVAPQDDGRAGD
jgi:CRP-like cAMP-binding protein